MKRFSTTFAFREIYRILLDLRKFGKKLQRQKIPYVVEDEETWHPHALLVGNRRVIGQ